MERQNYWTRRIHRRGFVGGVLATGAGTAALSLVGCGDDDGEGDARPTTGSIGQPQQPGQQVSPTPTRPVAQSAVEKSTREHVYNWRQSQVFGSLNPWKGLDSGGTWLFYIYDRMIYTPFDTLKPELFLATKIEQPEPTKIIFTLGNSVFHNKPPVNGRAVRAQDVKATLEESRKAPGISQTPFWTATFAGADTPDEKTVVVNLKQPDAWAFATSGLGGGINTSIVAEEHAKDPNKMDNEIVGSGRYTFEGHSNRTNFKFSRFDKWRGAPEPFLAGYQSKLITDQAAALAAFSAKEIDALGLNNKLEREQLVAKHGKDIEVFSELSRSVWTVQARGDGRWADPRARKALNMGLDRKEFVELLALGDGRPSGPVTPSFGSVALTEAELNAEYWKFDPAGAKALLAQSGFDTGTEIEIKYATLGDNFKKYAEIVSSQVEKNLGVKTKVVGEDLAKWLATSLYGSDYKDLIVYPTVAYEEPTTYLLMYTKDIGGRPNWGKFFDDELDAAFKKAATTLDDTARFQAYKDLQKKGIAKAAPIFTTHVQLSNTAQWGYVKGSVIGRGSIGLFNGKLYIDKG
jgi:ABC-type transport system substrate-binding protein